MYRKEQGMIVSRSECLEIFTVSNFQRRLRTWNDVNDILVRRKVKCRYTFWFGNETNQTVTFAICVIIATEKKGQWGWKFEQRLNVKQFSL